MPDSKLLQQSSASCRGLDRTNPSTNGHVGQLDHVGHQFRRPYRRASEIRTEPITWLWEGLIPFGCLTLLQGDSGQGKSGVICDLAAGVTRGWQEPFRQERRRPSSVVILEAEERFDQHLVPRLEAAGADRERVIVERGFVFPDDANRITELVCDVRAKLLVISPITEFANQSLNSAQGARRVLTPLQHLAEQENLAVVIVHHLNKAGIPAGSNALTQKARSVLRVEDDPSGRRFHHIIRLEDCSNLASGVPPHVFRTKKASNGTIVVEWIGEEAADGTHTCGRPPTQMECCKEFLWEVLGDGPLAVSDVKRMATEAGLSERTIRRAYEEIGEKAWREQGCKETRWLWGLRRRHPTTGDHVAMWLTNMLKASVVVGTSENPRVVADRDHISVVKYHINGEPKVTLDSSQIKSRGVVILKDPAPTVEFDLSFPDVDEQLRTELRKRNIIVNTGDFPAT